jgi:hypothetical protein
MPSLLDTISPGPLLGFMAQPTKEDTTSLLARIYGDLHAQQQAFIDDTDHKIVALCAGYGSGKTRALCAKAVHLAALNQGFLGCVLEPTGPLIRDIWQNDFDTFLEAYDIPYTFRASPLPEYVLHLPGGDTKILCRSFENWTRLIGLNLAWCLADEVDTVSKPLAQKAFTKILGRLRSGNIRQFGAASTPEGYAWLYENFGTEEAQAREDRHLIRMRTYDNPHLPPDFIETLKANYDPNLLKAYLEGLWVNLTTGTVYDRFNRAHHVRPLPPLIDPTTKIQKDYDHSRPHPDETILVGIDFNVGNTNAVMAVRRDRELFVFDEVAAAHDTDALGKEIRRRFPDSRILGYPDASGRNRSTNSSRSDIAILQSYDISNMAPSANPPVRDRVASVQAALENGNGDTRLWISPSCKKLIECLELQCWTEKGEPDKENNFDHMNDGLGYLVHRLFEVGRATAGKSVRGIRLY